MRWSFPLARVAGIPIRVHLSFLLVVGWIAWLGWGEEGLRSSLWAVALILALFGCVALHELGHSLVAVRFGAEVRSITLLPIGGVASMKSIPEQPSQELMISLAGPLVNIVIAGTLAAARGGFPSWVDASLIPRSAADWTDALIRANVVLAVFNLLPAFPMDGGRVVRSVLALFLPYVRATSLAAGIGQALAVGFILLGLAFNPFLLLIGFFVFFGAETEERAVRVKDLLRDVRAEDVMLTSFVGLQPSDTVGRCLDRAFHNRQEDFPVEHEGRLVGVLSRKDWLAALHRAGPDAPVAGVMRRNFISVDARTPLARFYPDMRGLEQGVFPVVKDGRTAGLLTVEDVSRYLVIREAGGNAGARAMDPVGRASSRLTIDMG